MAIEEVHLNDIGTSFELEIFDTIDGVTSLVNISAASTMAILFKKPNLDTNGNEVVVTKTANFVTDGTDGKINYITVDGDLDETGSWKIQGKVVLPTGTWSTDVSKFKVYSNLQ